MQQFYKQLVQFHFVLTSEKDIFKVIRTFVYSML